MAVLVGETKTRFWYGEKYVFERTAKGEWTCVYRDTAIIPASILDEIDTWE